MRRLAAGLAALCCWAGCGEDKYEPREGARLPAGERRSLPRYMGSLANVCNEGQAGADLRRQALRQMRAFVPLVRRKPNALMKVEVVSSDAVPPPKDVTLREYAADTREELLVQVPETEGVSACERRHARLFGRLAR